MTRSSGQAAGTQAALGAIRNPGDEAAPGKPGTGEDVCPVCRGNGKHEGRVCGNCGGTGRVVKAIGGG